MSSAHPLHDPLLPRSVRAAGDASRNNNNNNNNNNDDDDDDDDDDDGDTHPNRHRVVGVSGQRRTHSLPLGSTAVDVRAVARGGFKPLREATPVLTCWCALCVACLVLVLLPASDDDDDDEDGGGGGGGGGSGHGVKLGPFRDYRVRASLNTALLLASGALELVLRVVLKRRQRQGYLSFYRGVRKLLPQPFRIVAFGTAALLLVVALTLPAAAAPAPAAAPAAIQPSPPQPQGEAAAGRGGSTSGARVTVPFEHESESEPLLRAVPPGGHLRGWAIPAVQVIVAVQCLGVMAVLVTVAAHIRRHNLRAPVMPDAGRALTSALYDFGGGEEELDSFYRAAAAAAAAAEEEEEEEGEEEGRQGRVEGRRREGGEGEGEVVSEQQAEFNRYLCDQVRELGREVLRLQGQLQSASAAVGAGAGGDGGGGGFGLGPRRWRNGGNGSNGSLAGIDTDEGDDGDGDGDEEAQEMRRTAAARRHLFSLSQPQPEPGDGPPGAVRPSASAASELRAAREALTARDGEVSRLRAANQQHEEEAGRLRAMLEEWSGQAARLEARLEQQQQQLQYQQEQQEHRGGST